VQRTTRKRCGSCSSASAGRRFRSAEQSELRRIGAVTAHALADVAVGNDVPGV